MTLYKTKESVLAYVKSCPNFTNFFAVDHSGNRYRVEKEDDQNVFVYGKHMRRRGWRMTHEKFSVMYQASVKTDEDANEEWHRSIKRAIKCLDRSGLWPDIKTMLTNLSKMSLQDKKTIRLMYERDRRHENGRLIFLEPDFSSFIAKYPFAFHDVGTKEFGVNTEYIYEMSNVKLKSMYFGKTSNKEIKEMIAKAIDVKEEFSIRAKTGYDVSFFYDPVRNRATYSEEYRNCGNGHYYIALDENTALFAEDD